MKILKKGLFLVVSLALVCSFCACGAPTQDDLNQLSSESTYTPNPLPSVEVESTWDNQGTPGSVDTTYESSHDTTYESTEGIIPSVVDDAGDAMESIVNDVTNHTSTGTNRRK